MTKQSKSYRYELVHGEHVNFVAYQLKLDESVWQTVSVWMIPQTTC
jgi:hypothetical protein